MDRTTPLGITAMSVGEAWGDGLTERRIDRQKHFGRIKTNPLRGWPGQREDFDAASLDRKRQVRRSIAPRAFVQWKLLAPRIQGADLVVNSSRQVGQHHNVGDTM